MKELFEIPFQDSPKKAWIKKHNINTYCSGPAENFDGEPWNAWQGDLTEAIEDDIVRTGETELDAIVNLAKHMKIRLWNEETLTTTAAK